MEVAIIVPVLRRPHRVAPLVQSITEATSWPYRILFVVTPGDVDEYEAVRDVQRDYGPIVDLLVMDQAYEGRGDWARKINAGHRVTWERWIFTGADDLHFHPGWLEAAIAVAVRAPHVGVIGTNDWCNRRVMRGEHATHSLVRRTYVDELGTIDEPGKVLHEGYPHEGCDDEMVQTAMARGAWAFAPHSVVEHLHPIVDRGEWDDVYGTPDVRHARLVAGRALLAQRRRLWSAPG